MGARMAVELGVPSTPVSDLLPSKGTKSQQSPTEIMREFSMKRYRIGRHKQRNRDFHFFTNSTKVYEIVLVAVIKSESQRRLIVLPCLEQATCFRKAHDSVKLFEITDH